MKKRKFLFLVLLLTVNTLFAQQLSYRFVNPQITRGASYDIFQFDVQVKCSTTGTYLWGNDFGFSFNNTTFKAASVDWVVVFSPAFSANNSLGNPKYSVGAKNFVGSTGSKYLYLNISGDDFIISEPYAPVDDLVEITESYQTMFTLKARIYNNTLEAGIDFIESVTNGSQEFLIGTNLTEFYQDPSSFDSRDFSNTFVGRFYSSAGWTQSRNDASTPAINWTTSVNTSIWEGNVSMATADNTEALANNFSIHNDATLTIPANKWLTVAGTLTNPSVSSLTIESGGSLIHATNDVPATIKSDLTGNKYHQVCIPLTAAANPVSNLYLGSYLFSFTESGSVASAWTSLGVSTTTPLDVDKGYMMYYPDAATLAVSYAGNMRNGTVSPPLSFTDVDHGSNLVPNPYPSAIDWTLLTKTDLYDAIWIWNQNTLNYGAYGSEVGLGTSATTKFIPVGQSFFVRAKSLSSALTIENADRVHNAQAFVKSATTVENILHLTATGNNSADEVIVAFNSNWSVGADNADVTKMFGSDGAPQLSCVTADNNNLTINALPFGNGNVVVPLNFSLTANADVTFEAKGIESFSTDLPIYLDDLMLSKVIDLRVQPSYTFNHTVGNAGNRFQLRFMGVTGTPEQLEAKGNVFMSNGKLFVDVPSMNQSEVTIGVYDALGRHLTNNKMMVNGVTEVTTPAATGVYIVRVIGGNKTFAGKVFVN